MLRGETLPFCVFFRQLHVQPRKSWAWCLAPKGHRNYIDIRIGFEFCTARSRCSPLVSQQRVLLPAIPPMFSISRETANGKLCRTSKGDTETCFPAVIFGLNASTSNATTREVPISRSLCATNNRASRSCISKRQSAALISQLV